MTDPKQVIRELVSAVNEHDFERASRYLSPDCEIITPFATLRGREHFKAYLNGLVAAFPDLRQNVQTLIAEGTTVVVEWTLTGIHRGPLQTPAGPIPATGKAMAAHGCDVYRLEGEQVVSDRIYRDRQETLVQLGLAQEPAAVRS